MEGGSRVAYDPRDLETDGEAKKMPRLTLMEEVLLLGLNDRQVGQRTLVRCQSRNQLFVFWVLASLNRDTYRSGMTISHILYGGALSWS